MTTPRWTLLEGDARARLADIEDGSVQTCITSPPYYGLRDYGHDGQIGHEETPDLYVASLIAVFREVSRVLRDDGTLWLNLGDSYAGGPVSAAPRPGAGRADGVVDDRAQRNRNGVGAVPGLKPKDLLGIPWMVAFALRADGWYLRSDVIWTKPNPMPESVRDRPTRSHEYLFLLSKKPRYYYDAHAIREDDGGRASRNVARKVADTQGDRARMNTHLGSSVPWDAGGGRNKRDVWTVSTQPYPGAHFAVFPPKLIEPCVLAGSSDQACADCGAPWERILEPTGRLLKQQNGGPGTIRAHVEANGPHGATSSLETGFSQERATAGWRPTCEHADAGSSSLVLDPFAGAGTTAIVSLLHGRRFIGIELNAGYAALARDRIAADVGLFASA